MSSHLMDKNQWLETGCSYYSPQKIETISTPNKISPKMYHSVDKQNVVPCTAFIQSLISTLTQKNYELKSVQAQEQKFQDISINQQQTLQKQSIRQEYQAQKEVDLLYKNKKVLQEIQLVKKQKLRNIQKILAIKAPIQSRYEQILEMKKLKQQTYREHKQIQQKIKLIQTQNNNLRHHTNDLQLLSHQVNNQAFKMRQTVRQNQVQNITVQSALSSIKKKITQTIYQIKQQNKISKKIALDYVQKSDKIKKNTQQKYQNQIVYSELRYKNQQIDSINIKLRSDLQNCQSHLKSLLKNNKLLQNSIQQFTCIDDKVTRIIKRNELKNL